MTYRRCGRSGIRLPLVSLGLWHNFGSVDPFENSRKMMLKALTSESHISILPTITGLFREAPRRHSAGVISSELAPYRDEIIVSTKAGYLMWDGPYGEWGSAQEPHRKLQPEPEAHEAGLRRHILFAPCRPETPLEETMGALATIVGSGKALFTQEYPTIRRRLRQRPSQSSKI
jgi:L-glyceraldehyde 3-phosphate reductase